MHVCPVTVFTLNYPLSRYSGSTQTIGSVPAPCSDWGLSGRPQKGGGYHLDLFVLAILVVVLSILGLPWFVAATVLAINHVNSLKVESETAAPGEKPQFLGVR